MLLMDSKSNDPSGRPVPPPATANPPIRLARVVLVSSVGLDCEGIRLVLERAGFSVETAPGPDAIQSTSMDVEAPELFIVDPPGDAEAALWLAPLAGLRQRFESSRIVLLSRRLMPDWWSVCIQADLDGYLSKACPAAVFKRQLDLVLAGGRIFPFEILRDSIAVAARIGSVGARRRSTALSPADTQILRHLVAGYGNKAIASRLRVSEATVKARMKSVCQRLGVANRTQAAIWALKHGIEPADDRS